MAFLLLLTARKIDLEVVPLIMLLIGPHFGRCAARCVECLARHEVNSPDPTAHQAPHMAWHFLGRTGVAYSMHVGS